MIRQEKYLKRVSLSFPFLLGMLSFIFSFCLSACSIKRVPPSIAYALDGPVLAVIGEYGKTPIEGVMDRQAMVGIGTITLTSSDKKNDLVCKATIDQEPSEKGRVRGAFVCSDESVVAFTLRNLGPDQGVGIGKSINSDAMMTLFYHASKEEAIRRFPEVKEDFALVAKNLNK